ncbi:MAG: WG repeat-containing protein [Alistipes sp.]|nr:WG repeat-containing protein [Alistipes sp.]
MVPTLNCFLRALMTPSTSLRTLHDIEPMITIEGLPALQRTSRFAEVEIRRGGKHYLLSLPLTDEAIRYTEQVLQPLQRIRHTAWATIEVLSGELRWIDACGKEHRCDLVLQELPGSPFLEGIAPYTPAERAVLFDRLEATLNELGIAHNNLKAENLRVHQGMLIPIRCFDLTTDGNRERDCRALAHLRKEVGCEVRSASMCCDYAGSYTTTPSACDSMRFSEGLYRFEQNGRFGYADHEGRVCIAAQFLQAGDLIENRAVVCTEAGWGVIDRTGRWVIAPCYERIDYEQARSLFLLHRGNQIAVCNYLGELTTEFAPTEAELVLG